MSQPPTNATWDAPHVHVLLARLMLMRRRFVTLRLLQRLRSPRRIMATTLAIAFFVFYVLNGVLILSARTPADPARLKLWLSGGMVMYAMYHLVRCVWTKKIPDLELSRAEELWLGGGPIRRSSLAVYHIGNILVAALLKTSLLAVVLNCDVRHWELLVVGIFSSLVLLEIVRLIIQRWSAGLSAVGRYRMRIGITAIAGAAVLQIIARVMSTTQAGAPTWQYIMNGFNAMGATAESGAIQCLALPWMASSHLVVTNDYTLATLMLGALSVAMVPLSIFGLVRVDAAAQQARHRREQERLQSGDYLAGKARTQKMPSTSAREVRWQEFVDKRLPKTLQDAANLIARQAVSIQRYRATIIFSFVVPTLLCLSPLVTGQVTEQWFYVVGGIALCTMLLAPPALRLDFRRDLRRMMLLRSLPVRPISMVLGQLTLPILITLSFQWITIAVAAAVTQPDIWQVLMWIGLLAALAVFTFAAENALFLAYPHHERAEGIAMMIRTKLTFLGKGAVMVGALAMLVAWAMFCRNSLPDSWIQPTFVSGAIVVSWTIASISLVVAAWCWRRFDLSFDVPPE